MTLISTGAWAQEEGSCPAGAAGAACRGADEEQPAPRAKVLNPAPPAPAPPQVDLITQEIDELKALMKLGEDKMALLNELKGAASGDASLPLSESQVRALNEDLPIISDIASEGERTPVAASEDYLVSKTVMPLEEQTTHIDWILLRNQRPSTGSSSSSSSSAASQSQTPTCILAAAGPDGNVRLFSPTGELLLTFGAGHDQPLTQMAVSPTHEEHLVATGDAGGSIRLHRVTVRQRRLSKEERSARWNSSDEKISQYLGTQLNVTIQLQRQVQLPPGSSGEVPALTALALGTSRGTRQIVAGDSEGRISVFAKNGTLRGHVDATVMDSGGIEGLHSYHSQLLFRAGMEWGYVNVDKIDVKHIDCPKFEGRVAAAAVDSQQLSKVMLSDEAGTVWIFNVKNKKECEFEKKFPPSVPVKAPVELASIRGYVIGLQKVVPGQEEIPSSLLALNMSQHLGRKRPGESGPGGHVVWRKSKAPVRDWSVQKRQQQGDLVALLANDGKEIEILEILMQVYTPPPSSDPFSNFKLPIMACAVVLLLGYQYMKQKGKGGGGGGGFGGLGKSGGKFGKSDLAGLMSKRKGGLGGLGGLKKR